MRFLGLDIGTSAVKAVIVDEQENSLLEGEAPLSVSRPEPGFSEQDPAQWIAAVDRLLTRFATDDASIMASIGGIGLSGQMHGAVLLDAADKPLRPAILWNDSRATHEAQRLNSDHPELASIVGVPCAPGFTAPKLPWVAAREPEIAASLKRVLNPKDYVRLFLSGEVASDMSDAAGTWWLDQAKRDWSEAALDATGLTRRHMPRLVEGTDVAGTVRADIASRYKLPKHCILAGGAGDAIAGAVSVGAIENGAFLSLGTSAQLFAPTSSYRPLPEKFLHAFCHAAPGRWFQMAAMLNGASCFGFLSALVGKSVETLEAEAAGLPDGPADVIFLPYLSGERTPHNDAGATGAFFGMTASTTTAHLARAVLEGVAYSFADAATCLEAAGTRLTQAAVIGGGARNSLWVQILSDVLGIPLLRYRGAEKGPAFGAARLARIAATGQPITAVAVAPPIRDVTRPRMAMTQAYGAPLAHFRRLYAATRAARQGTA